MDNQEAIEQAVATAGEEIIVNTAVLQEVVNILSTLPFGQVNGVMVKLMNSVRILDEDKAA